MTIFFFKRWACICLVIVCGFATQSQASDPIEVIDLSPLGEPLLEDQPKNTDILEVALSKLGDGADTESVFASKKFREGLPHILNTHSMILWNSSHTVVVLYFIYGDIFAIIDYNDSLAFFAAGSTVHSLISRGMLAEEENLIERLFHVRPQLQRALVDFIDHDQPRVKKFLAGLQTDVDEIRLLAGGFAAAVVSMSNVAAAECLGDASNDVKFLPRFSNSLRLNALWKLADGDYYIFQDNKVGRVFAALGYDPLAGCKLIRKQDMIISF